MTGPILSVSVLLGCLVASAIAGVVIRRKPISLLISSVFGLVTAIVRIQYDPDPAAAPGLVGYPVMCMFMNGLGRLLWRNMGTGSRKGGDRAPPVA